MSPYLVEIATFAICVWGIAVHVKSSIRRVLLSFAVVFMCAGGFLVNSASETGRPPFAA